MRENSVGANNSAVKLYRNERDERNHDGMQESHRTYFSFNGVKMNFSLSIILYS